jgi:hypothetical protein
MRAMHLRKRLYISAGGFKNIGATTTRQVRKGVLHVQLAIRHPAGCEQPTLRGSAHGCRSLSLSHVSDRVVPGLFWHLPRPQVLGVITSFEKMGCETIAQGMRCNVLGDSSGSANGSL